MFRDAKVTALIPIKEHSERINGKNFRDFCGRPLYRHILATLQDTPAVDEVVINTDSDRILDEAPRLFPKVRCHRRPPELCGDEVSTNRIFAYDLSRTQADLYLQTHATNPLLRPGTIVQALEAFEARRETHDSLFTVNRYQSRFYDRDGVAINHDPEILIRTQDLPPMYEENSVLYVFTRDSFAKAGRRIGLTPQMFETPPAESIDIDDAFSFHVGELLGKSLGL